MSELELYSEKTFENLKRVDENGNEYWEARELQKALAYTECRKFNGAINKAKDSCGNSNYKFEDLFVDIDKMGKTGDSIRKIDNYNLSRYACYLIVQNGAW